MQVPVACLSVLFCTIKSRVKCVEVFLIQSILYDAQGFTEISNLSNCHQTQCLSGVEGALNFEKYIRKSGCHIGVQTNFGENKMFVF